MNKYDIIILFMLCYGDVAQLARASGSYPEGRGFDSLRRYQLKITRESRVFLYNFFENINLKT